MGYWNLLWDLRKIWSRQSDSLLITGGGVPVTPLLHLYKIFNSMKVLILI